ncbi:MAG: polar amino acid transport system substrate-binding protein [Alteromonadaceae bacterium]|jgi:polar amino acid transport system substrate-binding protein
MIKFIAFYITFIIPFPVHSFIVPSIKTPSITKPLITKQIKNITLGTTNASDTPLYQKAKRILTYAFAELDYSLTIKTLPNKRSLSWANEGKLDGDLFRISNLNLTEFSNLQQVKEPLFTIDQSVISKQNIVVDGWNSMKSYILAYERGTKFIDEKQDRFKDVILVNSSEQAFDMIYVDRADITITSSSTAKRILNKHKKFEKKIKILEPPLIKITLHVYLNHQRHQGLADELSSVLTQMKQDGRFERFLDK